jgi:hypothetical protein
VALDGTLIPIGRLAAGWPSHSGKHRRHDMNLQLIASPDGEIFGVSGAVHDLTAVRIWGILRELAAAGSIALADRATPTLATRCPRPTAAAANPLPRGP